MQLLQRTGLFLYALFLLLFTGCQKDKPCGTCPGNDSPTVSNRPPEANAGAGVSMLWPEDSATLNGTASTDPDNNIKAYRWQKVAGPAAGRLSDPGAAITRVTNLEVGLYSFELTVTDAGGLSSKDTVQVKVFEVGTAACDGPRPRVAASLVPAGNLSIPRINMAVAAAGTKIVFAGGYSGDWDNYNEYTRVDILDVATNTWSVHELSRPVSSAITAVLGTKVFIAGGYQGPDARNTVEVYDAATGIWSSLTLPQQVNRGNMEVAAAAGNKVLFVSGVSSPDGAPYKAYTIVEIFDVVANTWHTDTLHRRTNEAVSDAGISATVIGSRVYLAGNASAWYGYGAGNVSATIDIYDAATNSWSASELKQPRGFMGAVAAGNKNFWAGGIMDKSGYWTDVVEIRDMTTGTSTFSCLSNRRAHFTAVQKGDKVVFFTSYFYGQSNDPAIPDYPRTTFDIYDLTTNTWSVGVLPKEISAASIVSLNNTIYVTEGYENLTLSKASSQVWKLEF